VVVLTGDVGGCWVVMVGFVLGGWLDLCFGGSALAGSMRQ